jgi:hypothetical protein
MSLCRREPCTARVSEVYLGEWGECVLRSASLIWYKVLIYLYNVLTLDLSM